MQWCQHLRRQYNSDLKEEQEEYSRGHLSDNEEVLTHKVGRVEAIQGRDTVHSDRGNSLRAAEGGEANSPNKWNIIYPAADATSPIAT